MSEAAIARQILALAADMTPTSSSKTMAVGAKTLVITPEQLDSDEDDVGWHLYVCGRDLVPQQSFWAPTPTDLIIQTYRAALVLAGSPSTEGQYSFPVQPGLPQ